MLPFLCMDKILFMVDKPNQIGLFRSIYEKQPGENVPPLAAALEECLGILSILERTPPGEAHSLSRRPSL